MTPKKKAYLLYTTYRFAMAALNADNGVNNDNISKQCALIAVNEILSVMDYPCEQYNYYLEVKQEIEKYSD